MALIAEIIYDYKRFIPDNILLCQLNKGMISQMNTDYPAPKLRNLAGSRFAGEETDKHRYFRWHL